MRAIRKAIESGTFSSFRASVPRGVFAPHTRVNDSRRNRSVLPRHGAARPVNQNIWVSLMPIRAHDRHLLRPRAHADAASGRRRSRSSRAALKVGDRVITTSGIYGVITKLDDKAVQIQIADKVRIDVARAAVGGYQGEEPVVPAGQRRALSIMKQHASVQTRRDRPRCGAGDLVLHAALTEGPARPRPSRWRHLVLGVQTDDALRLETETSSEQLKQALADAKITVTTTPALTRFHGARECRQPATRSSGRSPTAQVGLTYNRDAGSERLLYLPDEAERRRADPPGRGDAGD